MFERIYRRLKQSGFNVFSIGQHMGICESPYVVIREGGERVLSGSQVSAAVVGIIIFYPVGRYSDVSAYIESVKECLKDINGLKSTGETTALVIDHDVRAYTCSIIYEIYKRRS